MGSSGQQTDTLARALYLGGLFPGCTGLQRLWALRELGYDVSTFDFDPFVRKGPRLVRALHHWLTFGPRLEALN